MTKIWLIATTLFMLSASQGVAADISDFFGGYSGSAKIEDDVENTARDMSVQITETDGGFKVAWTSITHKADGGLKEKGYVIGFVPSPRGGIFASAMKLNLFGKPVPLDPLQGDPYVWSRISEDTLTVYSLLIDEDGGYEVQEYDRTLTNGGLNLEYRRIRNGEKLKAITAFLEKN
jgi:hypothetical protein